MKLPDILTQKDVLELTTLSRSTMYHFIQTQNFPAPKKIGSRKVFWSKKEVLLWLKNKGFDIEQKQKL